MRKADIDTYWDRSRRLPAINVKVYDVGITESDVQERFGCTYEQAEQAIRFAFESAQERFWESAMELAEHCLSRRGIFKYEAVTVYQLGRCGGWLVVDGLPELERWDAIAVTQWAGFVKAIEADIAFLKECLLDNIEANEWYKAGAEQYNFIDGADGPICIADMKQQAIDAGFGPVVRV